MLGKQKFYFIPDVGSDELRIKQDYVLATEFDPKDATFKVRFLNGDAVQMFAVHDTEEEVRAEFEKFQEYRKIYNECIEKYLPIQNELQNKYKEMYGEFVDDEFLKIINDRHNVNKVVAEAEAKEKVANDNAAR